MPDVAVLDDPVVAAAVLDPARSRLLGALAEEPASAAGVAARLDLPRQQIGYHLTGLAAKGLVVEVERRRHGGLTERIFGPSAGSYVVSPAALGSIGADPRRVGDRLSAAFTVAVAARVVREVGRLLSGAERAGRRLPTLAIDADVRLRDAAARAAFADDLAAAVRDVVAKHHDPEAPGGRWYRLVALSHPIPPEPTAPAAQP